MLRSLHSGVDASRAQRAGYCARRPKGAQREVVLASIGRGLGTTSAPGEQGFEPAPVSPSARPNSAAGASSRTSPSGLRRPWPRPSSRWPRGRPRVRSRRRSGSCGRPEAAGRLPGALGSPQSPDLPLDPPQPQEDGVLVGAVAMVVMVLVRVSLGLHDLNHIPPWGIVPETETPHRKERP